ncbi:hypothetical protein [Kitasatospora sp. NPDC051914]|uniref:hypothetical protein n=1 Tax=Kitasatospora sp. NPDC051914 TaxID=3154945 RepID=UPI0034311703
MIQIRIICRTDDEPFVVRDLCRTWSVHEVRTYAAREPGHLRLYITASRPDCPRQLPAE